MQIKHAYNISRIDRLLIAIEIVCNSLLETRKVSSQHLLQIAKDSNDFTLKLRIRVTIPICIMRPKILLILSFREYLKKNLEFELELRFEELRFANLLLLIFLFRLCFNAIFSIFGISSK